jgi:endonuclease/exonuclease/phosphatase family metal-dependent hydrolase
MADHGLKLRIGTYNLRDGGLDNKAAARLASQVDMLARLDLDLLALQEAKWGTYRESHRGYVAKRLGMTWSSRVPSSFHRCDIAMFVRATEHLRTGKERHLQGPPWVHAHGDVELTVAGQPHPWRFMAGHMSPGSPTIRLAEAEMMGVYRTLPLIYVADFNSVALGESPDLTGVEPAHAKRKLDTRAAQALAEDGFLDVGAHRQDSTPTVGHNRTDRLAYRCDRIYTTLPSVWITGYGVVDDADDLSDHRAVWAEITLPFTAPA